METLRKYWAYIVSFLALIFGAFFYEKSKREEAEAKLINTDNTVDNAILATKIDSLNSQIQEAKSQNEIEKAKQKTAEELLEELKKI